ncbi:MAG: ABC transporter six-transmembrane domain-containing protein [Planctomycetota bacterium]
MRSSQTDASIETASSWRSDDEGKPEVLSLRAVFASFRWRILATWLLQTHVFVACLTATGVILIIYTVTSQRTLALNKDANDESEKSVALIADATIAEVRSHFGRLMRWNIRLSDLETATFSLSWLVMVALLLFSVIATIQSGVTAQGKVLSILMYVFGYIESVIALPLFYQQFLRLREIAGRLEAR